MDNNKRQTLLVLMLAMVCFGFLPGQNIVSGTPFQPGAATHETWMDSQAALQFSNASEVAAKIEAVSSAPATRSSFMASWENVSGATGYLLDVSTNDSFNDYVEGYHDLDVGNVTGRVVTGLNPGTTYYCRVRPYTATGPGSYSQAMTATTVPTTGVIIHATFDSSITGNANAAAIEAMINRAVSIYESLFSDPITIQILFRYATTSPDGTPLPAGRISQSNYVYYSIPWNTAVDALRADAKTSNDNLAIASLPANALSANILPASANGRAVGERIPHRRCSQTAQSAMAGRTTGSLRLILQIHFSSPGPRPAATLTRNVQQSMKLTRSSGLDRASATISATFGRRMCSAARQLASEILLQTARAISRSTAASPTLSVSIRQLLSISVIG